MNKKGRSIIVYSPKGGVGKTILTMNLAGIFSIKDKHVLVIDLDLFNGGISLLAKKDISNRNIFKLNEDRNNGVFKTIEDYVIRYNKNIDLLCAPKDPRDAVKILPSNIGKLIDEMEYEYDYVLIDTSSYLDKINLNALDEADRILLITTNDLMSIKNMKNIITIFKDSGVENYRVILNESVDNVDKYFDNKDIRRIIGANVDYKIDSTFFIKDLTSYIYNREIPSLNNNIRRIYKKELIKLENIINDILRDGEVSE